MRRAALLATGIGVLLTSAALAVTPLPKPNLPSLASAPSARNTSSGTATAAAHGPLTLIMRGLDKISGRPTILIAPIGKTIQYATLSITARTCYSTPASETPETAAFVQIDDHRPDKPQRRVFSGWMYASSPGLNGMQHPLYDVWVINCRTAEPGQTVAVGPIKPVKPASPDASDNEKPVELPEDASQ